MQHKVLLFLTTSGANTILMNNSSYAHRSRLDGPFFADYDDIHGDLLKKVAPKHSNNPSSDKKLFTVIIGAL